jgi:hypothetical protein
VPEVDYSDLAAVWVAAPVTRHTVGDEKAIPALWLTEPQIFHSAVPFKPDEARSPTLAHDSDRPTTTS